jgi:hypothetical protein
MFHHRCRLNFNFHIVSHRYVDSTYNAPPLPVLPARTPYLPSPNRSTTSPVSHTVPSASRSYRIVSTAVQHHPLAQSTGPHSYTASDTLSSYASPRQSPSVDHRCQDGRRQIHRVIRRHHGNWWTVGVEDKYEGVQGRDARTRGSQRVRAILQRRCVWGSLTRCFQAVCLLSSS